MNVWGILVISIVVIGSILLGYALGTARYKDTDDG